jgi:hypothetical protein
MRLGDLFKKIFGSSAAIPVDERTLSSTNEDVLASSLEKLADGERGWIPFAQAALLVRFAITLLLRIHRSAGASRRPRSASGGTGEIVSRQSAPILGSAANARPLAARRYCIASS